jgi:hypothetical protein
LLKKLLQKPARVRAAACGVRFPHVWTTEPTPAATSKTIGDANV